MNHGRNRRVPRKHGIQIAAQSKNLGLKTPEQSGQPRVHHFDPLDAFRIADLEDGFILTVQVQVEKIIGLPLSVENLLETAQSVHGFVAVELKGFFLCR